MPSPRIAPLQSPYEPAIQAAFERIMPPGVPPLELFRCVAQNPRVLQRMLAGGLLDPGSISVRQRELLILRCTGLCRAEYEWGVHVAFFGAAAGFSQAQLANTYEPQICSQLWDESECILLALADSLHAQTMVDDALWLRFGEYFTAPQQVECLMLIGLYHAVSFLVNGLRLTPETFAPTFARG
jgi:hypothetical protein